MFDNPQTAAAWLGAAPLLPLAAAVVTAGMRPDRGHECGRLAIGAMAGALVIALGALASCVSASGDGAGGGAGGRASVNFFWFTAGGRGVEFGVLLDPLSTSMAAMVAGVGLLIFIYSTAYLADDPRQGRFFGYLSLFAAGMLGLVVSNSLLLLFMSWEIVGLASYLLIGFWFEKPAAAAAARKAFMVTRLGDLGFLIGLVWAYTAGGTLLFYDRGFGLLEPRQVEALAGLPVMVGLSTAGAVALLLFAGAVGKSGQFPLHIWLPDAMEGPTPVSALIHAATMVAAGVFLVARCAALFAPVPNVQEVVATVGATTALLAALIALAQYDIKRILAYSTVSQLGLMMVGLAFGGVAVGMFHLLAHAFFKALLFLGAGSVIHGCFGEQDIRRMGGLARAMPTTTATYLCGAAALCALPYVTSGFYSKDEILLGALGRSPVIFWTCALASLLTSVYMARQCIYAFAGSYRGMTKSPHESPLTMTAPLVVLAVFAIGFGPAAVAAGILPFLEGVSAAKYAAAHPHSGAAVAGVVAVSCAVSLGGLALGYLLYGRRLITPEAPDPLGERLPATYRTLERKAYCDEVFEATAGRGFLGFGATLEFLDRCWAEVTGLVADFARGTARFVAYFADRTVIDRWSFDGLCAAVRAGGFLATRPATGGLLSNHLRAIALGAIALGLLVWWAGLAR